MDKKEASKVLSDELYELSVVLEKAKAIAESSQEYFFNECEKKSMQEKLNSADWLHRIMLEYIERACLLVQYISA